MGTPTYKATVKAMRPIKRQKNTTVPKLDKTFNRSFIRVLTQNKPIPILFCELVNKLGKWFSITKATLAIYHHQTGTLKLASWWDMYCFKQGVLMSLPTENSLFFRSLQSNRPLHQQVKSHFPGNWVERRIMATETTEALVVYPLVFNGVVHGVISLSSPVPYAFEMLEQGYLCTVFEKMAAILNDRSPKEFWQPLFAATSRGVTGADDLAGASHLLENMPEYNEVEQISRHYYRDSLELERTQ